MVNKRNILTIILIFSLFSLKAQTLPQIVENNNQVKQLIVNGKPFIFLSGELNNSTSSNLDYLAPRMENLKDRHLNSVIASISWELFEPVEGKYDYTLVKGIIDQARQNDLKLILIWFATWKNAGSTYVPEWVKNDIVRFPRMQIKTGENTGTLSAFGKNTQQADEKAFAALMKYIRQYDAKEQTVLMMQVENETGIMGSSRDRNDMAETAFHQAVPDELLDYLNAKENQLIPELQRMIQGRSLKKGATWEEVFGQGADECFSAWYISAYVNEVTKAGKAEYNLPMYVNAWVDWSFSKDLIPDYPSGGPVSKMFDIWQAGAPAIDLIGADVYPDDFKQLCRMYTQNGNPLFLPELAPSVRQAAYVYYAIGQNALCFAPFGIDNSFSPEKAAVLSRSYESLKGFLPFFAQHCGKDKNVGLLFTGKKEEWLQLGEYNIHVEYLSERNEDKNSPESGGLILQVGEDEFYIGGIKMKLHFYSRKDGMHTEFSLHEEGVFKAGQWLPERRMNGDELEIQISEPSIRRVKYYLFK
ncbi:MAG: hypothetical protein EZS26_001915 [Candidatus Ordinivivax streblomastigis]|uniref:Beta-galactosidase n=1 Tax=Candidatus Ordinivivax streblomastigis TaxID=2540710 RepID=A0A5M8P0J7_9BACT|nr:MAG: hypothetical protein EZS26_001915 [Candidatus Ordinivivax streblomastigis]